MQEILEQHCLEKDTTGLLLLSMPTGFGKTHNVLDFIYKHYRDFAEQKRKIFFITNLKKNLPFLELKERFKADNAEDDYDKYVIFINSNSESVINNLLSVDSQIPEQFKVKSYLDLKSYVETLENSERMDKKVKIALSEQIRKELEPDFRKFITNQLNQEFKTKVERLDAVKTNPDCNRSGIHYATDGMKGSPLNAPPIAMSTASPFFLTVEIYPRTLQKFVAPSLLLNVPEIFC